MEISVCANAMQYGTVKQMHGETEKGLGRVERGTQSTEDEQKCVP